MNNPNCDGENCSHSSGEIRILPIPDGNMLLCHSCFEYEINSRKQFNCETDVGELEIPNWNDLKTYETK